MSEGRVEEEWKKEEEEEEGREGYGVERDEERQTRGGRKEGGTYPHKIPEKVYQSQSQITV